MTRPIRIATRRSPLALAQAQLVAIQLVRSTGVEPVMVPVVTAGDTATGSLTALGGTGVFVTAVRQALLNGDADVAVHSLKDLPTRAEPNLVLAAVPVRADARDALVAVGVGASGTLGRGTPPGAAKGIAALPTAARVGTGSPRRAAQLRRLRPDLEVVDVRGNVATRLATVESGMLDAVILAQAGIDRLGLDVRSTPFPVNEFLPAAGQGALAVEATLAALEEPTFAAAIAQLDDPATRAAVTAERELLALLEAGCTAPVGAHAVLVVKPVVRPGVKPGTQLLELTSTVIATDGTQEIRMSTTGPMSAPTQLGRQLASELLSAGAATLLGEFLH